MRKTVLQICSLAQDVPHGTRAAVTLAGVAQGYPGKGAKPAARGNGIPLQVIRRKDATSGGVLLPRRGVVARSAGWVKRLRRVARDDVR